MTSKDFPGLNRINPLPIKLSYNNLTHMQLCLASVSVQPFNRRCRIYSVFSFFYQDNILNMLNIKCDINQQDLKIVDLYFVKSE